MGLKRVLGPVDAGWLVAGNMIGAGIFLTPSAVAGLFPGLLWPLLAWTLGGVLAFCGAAVYGELGARLPQAGGDYVYLTAAFGRFWGFLTGWAGLLLTFSAAAALMAIVAVAHLGSAVASFAVEPPGWYVPVGAPLVVLSLTLANTAGVRVGGRTTTLFTATPLVGLMVLFGLGLLLGETEIAVPRSASPPSGGLLLALGAAMLPVYFTYSGWNAAAYLAGEIRDPGRNLARGLLGGTAFVMLIYLVINLVFLIVVPPEILTGTTTAGAEAARLLLGPKAEGVLSLLIALALMGSANVTLMAGARVYYAMALDGLALPAMGRTNRAGVPGVALWIGGAWSAALAATGRFQDLLNWTTLAILLLSSLAAASLFVLRRRNVGSTRYLCWGYPFTPIVYLVASLAVACAAAIDQPKQSFYGLLFVASGIPAYWLVRRLRLGLGVTS